MDGFVLGLIAGIIVTIGLGAIIANRMQADMDEKEHRRAEPDYDETARRGLERLRRPRTEAR